VNKGETMRLCRFFLRGAAVAAWACLVGPAAAQTPGRLILVDAPGISGDIVAVSPIGVEIDVRGEAKKVPIESIREVTFAGEPQSLRAARVAVNRGQPAQALEDIAKIEPGEMDGVDQLIADELEFVKAAAVGGQAAASGENIAAGLKAVQGYVGKHPQTHHLFAMQELLARLLSRSGKFDEAAAALAGLFYDQKKYDDAAREYAAAAQATTDPKDTASAAQKRAAELGVARCRSRLGKPDEAVAIVDRVLAASGADDTEVLGAAYNALGDAMRAAGKDQDAIIAYLTVDLVHNKAPENRAEALFNLVELWDKGKSPQRAEEARQQLLQAYPDTVWARKLAAPKGS
jgi:tetratricopeptide (TPR) repeat protein